MTSAAAASASTATAMLKVVTAHDRFDYWIGIKELGPLAGFRKELESTCGQSRNLHVFAGPTERENATKIANENDS